MSKDTRTGWLAELKVADLVIVDFNGKYIRKIDKITPTGRMNVDSYVFNQQGIGMGFDYGAPRLEKYSVEKHQEIKDFRAKINLGHELNQINFKGLSLEKLIKIKEIIGEQDE